MTSAVLRPWVVVGGIALLGLVTAACEPEYPPPPPRPYTYADHVRWCFRHHGAYNPNTNVYIADDGSPHICVER